MSKMTERAYNIAAMVYRPSDERYLMMKDVVECAQENAVRDAMAALNFDRLVDALEAGTSSFDTRKIKDEALVTVFTRALQRSKPGRRFRPAIYALILAALDLTEQDHTITTADNQEPEGANAQP